METQRSWEMGNFLHLRNSHEREDVRSSQLCPAGPLCYKGCERLCTHYQPAQTTHSTFSLFPKHPPPFGAVPELSLGLSTQLLLQGRCRDENPLWAVFYGGQGKKAELARSGGAEACKEHRHSSWRRNFEFFSPISWWL